jgi:hypothetical protein
MITKRVKLFRYLILKKKTFENFYNSDPHKKTSWLVLHDIFIESMRK